MLPCLRSGTLLASLPTIIGPLGLLAAGCALAIAGPAPLGPALGVALLGLGVGLVWQQGRRAAAASADAAVLREVIDNIPHRVFWKDAELNYLGANRSFARDAGIENPRDIVGQSDFDMVWSREQSEFFRSVDRRVMAEGKPVLNLEEPITRTDGEDAMLLTSKVPLRNQNGDIIGILGMFIDITERKQMELELVKARAEAEAASAAKSVFLANTSHEMRTPLNGVLGMLDLALDAPMPDEVRGQLGVARASALALLGVINDVLDLSRLGSDRLTLAPAPTPLGRLLAELYHTHRQAADARGLDFTVALDGPVPAEIHTDPLRLRQCLGNLIGNAVKFTEQGSVELRVRRAADPAGGPGTLVFAVIDTGIGIPAAALPTLFDSFTQAHGARSVSAGGAGLGLSICSRLAALLGGSLAVESTEGEGTTFTLGLALDSLAPRGQLEALDLRIEAHSAAVATLPPLAGRVLVAEDNPVNQQVAVAMLERMGVACTMVDDGAAALAAWQEAEDGHYDVILTDVHMPRMDGLELVRTLRAQGATVPIVALTASTLREDVRAALDAGCDHHLAKPIRRAALHDVLALTLPGRLPGREEATA